MSTYGGGMKIDSAEVSASANTAGAHTLYTVPANKYAIINWVIHPTNGTGAGTIEIDGTAFASVAAGTATNSFVGSQASTSAYPSQGVIHAGPGAIISTTIAANCFVGIEGVLFKN